MLTQVDQPGTDDWWLNRLAVAMGKDFVRLGKLRKYREGDAPVPEDQAVNVKAMYAAAIKRGRLNMADLIVAAKTDRQKPLGFRTAVVGDDLGDESAQAMWRRSHMPVQVRDLLADVGHYGSAYLAVAQNPVKTSKTESLPLVIPASPWTVYGEAYGNRPWLLEGAIQVAYDDTLGGDTITLFRPGYARTALHKTDQSRVPQDGTQWNPGTDWDWTSGPQSLPWCPDQVPVVRVRAQDGTGFYEKHLDTLDRINEVIKQRLAIIAMQAYRQRAVKGDLPRTYPDDHPTNPGQPIDYDSIFEAGPAALWLLPNGADIWESSVTDIGPILNAAKDDIRDLAAVTRTPLYVLAPDAAAGSAEGASLAREMLLFSVEDLNDRAAAAFALTLALAFSAAGDEQRAQADSIDTIWAAIDRTSIVERATASQAAKAGGMPQRFIDEKVFGFTPEEIRQAKQDREDDLYEATLAAQRATSTATDSSPQSGTSSAVQPPDTGAASGDSADAQPADQVV